MPKRMCPFDYDLIPQQKMHISEKEIDNEFLKTSLYEKTLSMLFMGAKRPPKTEKVEIKLKNCTSEPKPSYKQMLLDNCCKLLPGGKSVPEPKIFCGNCCGSETEKQANCTFCERLLCEKCIMKCATCEEDFCRGCTLLLCRQSEDERLCLECCR